MVHSSDTSDGGASQLTVGDILLIVGQIAFDCPLRWDIGKAEQQIGREGRTHWSRARPLNQRAHIFSTNGLLFSRQLYSGEKLVSASLLRQRIQRGNLVIHLGIALAAEQADVLGSTP